MLKFAEYTNKLTSFNLKNISYEKMKRVIEAVKKNTNLKILTMSNIDMPDSVANVIDTKKPDQRNSCILT